MFCSVVFCPFYWIVFHLGHHLSIYCHAKNKTRSFQITGRRVISFVNNQTNWLGLSKCVESELVKMDKLKLSYHLFCIFIITVSLMVWSQSDHSNYNNKQFSYYLSTKNLLIIKNLIMIIIMFIIIFTVGFITDIKYLNIYSFYLLNRCTLFKDFQVILFNSNRYFRICDSGVFDEPCRECSQCAYVAITRTFVCKSILSQTIFIYFFYIFWK